jgi:hypothetical protein
MSAGQVLAKSSGREKHHTSCVARRDPLVSLDSVKIVRDRMTPCLCAATGDEGEIGVFAKAGGGAALLGKRWSEEATAAEGSLVAAFARDDPMFSSRATRGAVRTGSDVKDRTLRIEGCGTRQEKAKGTAPIRRLALSGKTGRRQAPPLKKPNAERRFRGDRTTGLGW